MKKWILYGLQLAIFAWFAVWTFQPYIRYSGFMNQYVPLTGIQVAALSVAYDDLAQRLAQDHIAINLDDYSLSIREERHSWTVTFSPKQLNARPHMCTLDKSTLRILSESGIDTAQGPKR